MKIYLATDHTGFACKEKVKTFLQEKGYSVEDCGAFTLDADDDYPDFISIAAEAVSKDPEESRGIIFGGSGQGEAMLANKYRGVRCAVFYAKAVPVEAADVNGRVSHDPFEIVRLSREHNNANMLSLSARFLLEEDMLKAIKIWLAQPFLNGERHARRIKKIKEIEDSPRH